MHTDKEEDRRRWEDQKRTADEWAQATREIETAADDLVRRLKWAAMNAPGNAELGWLGRVMFRSTSIAAGVCVARKCAEANVVAIDKLRLEPLPAPAEPTPASPDVDICREPTCAPTTHLAHPFVPIEMVPGHRASPDAIPDPRAGDAAPTSDDDIPF